jgi:hypothetical protein
VQSYGEKMKLPNIFSEKMLKDRKYFVEDEGGSEGWIQVLISLRLNNAGKYRCSLFWC